MKASAMGRTGIIALGIALAVAGCSKKAETDETATETAATNETPAATTANTAAPAATSAPAADNVDTISGVKFASYTGDAAKGEAAFVVCKTCHAVEPGVNKIGPSLHGVVGRTSGSVAGYNYSAANKAGHITWTEAKLFQYLENPQRVVPGTKMTYTGIPDPQKRADVIAYLKTQS